VEWRRGEAIELSGIELREPRRRYRNQNLPRRLQRWGMTDSGTVSTPATVGEPAERVVLTDTTSGERLAEYQFAPFAPATAGVPSCWPRTT